MVDPNARTAYPPEAHPVTLSSSSFTAVGETTKQVIRFQIQEPHLYRCVESRYVPFYPKPSVHSLAEFQKAWDEFANEPNFVEAVATVAPHGAGGGGAIAYQYFDVSEQDGRTVDDPKITSKAVELTLSGEQCDTGDATTRLHLIFLRGNSENGNFVLHVGSTTRSVALPPLLVPLPNVSSGQKLPEVVVAFAELFPDLAEAGKGRMNEDFVTLGPEIRSESNKGDEAFDAFGVKFPTEQITRWGIILLIGVQLYFLMYLRRFSNKLKSEDPAWDVPWMAMDQSRLARILLFVSVLCLPIYAACLVAVKAIQDFPREPIPYVIHSIFVTANLWHLRHFWSVIVFLVSVSLSVQCWRYRPRLTEPVAPSQMFE